MPAPAQPLTGDITQWTAAGHARHIAQLAAGDALDLSGVNRADSSAVALLLAIRRAKGAPLELTGTPPQLQQLLDFFGVHPLLTE